LVNSVSTLVEQAFNIQRSSKDSKLRADLFPNTELWSEHLHSLIKTPVDPALGVITPFAGAVFLVRPDHAYDPLELDRDDNGFCIAFRMAMYATGLLRQEIELSTDNASPDRLYLLSLTNQLTKTQMDIMENNLLWESDLKGVALGEVQQFMADFEHITAFIAQCASNWRPAFSGLLSYDPSRVVAVVISKLIVASGTNTELSYYAAKALATWLEILVGELGWDSHGADKWLGELDILKSSTTNIMGASAVLIGLKKVLVPSQLVNNLCNRLISDVALALSEADSTLGLLVLLNAVLSVYDADVLPVAKTRVIFAVKQILSWKEILKVNSRLASEACRALQRLLPAVNGLYGEYWESSLLLCTSIWISKEDGQLSGDNIPVIGMSLELFSILERLQKSNEDLQDAFGDSQNHSIVSQSLISLLHFSREKSNVPLTKVDKLLFQKVHHIDLKTMGVKDLVPFYPLVASNFEYVQSSSFVIINGVLRNAQDDIGVKAVADDKGMYICFSDVGILTMFQKPSCPRSFYLFCLTHLVMKASMVCR